MLNTINYDTQRKQMINFSKFYILVLYNLRRWFNNTVKHTGFLFDFCKGLTLFELAILDPQNPSIYRNHKSAQSISDVSWSSFVSKLQYKANWYGREIFKIDKWFPSSQICLACGYKGGKKLLDIREWTCPICHTDHERDTNASKNILTEGLGMQALV